MGEDQEREKMAEDMIAGKRRSRKTTRVQLELPDKSMERLSNLKDVTEASSYVEVIKDALRLYEDVINEVEKGNVIMLKYKDGTTAPYRIFL